MIPIVKYFIAVAVLVPLSSQAQTFENNLQSFDGKRVHKLNDFLKTNGFDDYDCLVLGYKVGQFNNVILRASDGRDIRMFFPKLKSYGSEEELTRMMEEGLDSKELRNRRIRYIEIYDPKAREQSE